MKYIILACLLSTFFFTLSCTEENLDGATEGMYTVASATCDGVTTSVSGKTLSLVFSEDEPRTFGWSGSAIVSSSLEICSGSYTLTDSNFDDDGVFSFTRSAAATTCLDEDLTSVESCSTGGVSCSTASSDVSVTLSGEYTKTATELVLTFTSTGESYCADGEEEVVTLEIDEDDE